MSQSLPLAEVRNRLSEVVDQIQREHDRVVITKHGRPAAVVMSIEDLESLEETLAILSDPDLLARVRSAGDEIVSGEVDRVSKDELLARLGDG
jgi:prevent-host-death family protein